METGFNHTEPNYSRRRKLHTSYPALKSYAGEASRVFTDLVGTFIVLPRSLSSSIDSTMSLNSGGKINIESRDDCENSKSLHSYTEVWMETDVGNEGNIYEKKNQRDSINEPSLNRYSEIKSKRTDKLTCRILDGFCTELEKEARSKIQEENLKDLENISDIGSELSRDDRNLREAEKSLHEELQAVAWEAFPLLQSRYQKIGIEKTTIIMNERNSWHEKMESVIRSFINTVFKGAMAHERAEYALGYGIEQSHRFVYR